MPPRPILFGTAYSVYVRAVRLVLAEKNVPHDLVEVDVFAAAGLPADYRQRHAFGRIPAFEHDGFRLYESAAIERYVDEAFVGPQLQPSDAASRARMNQITGILDNYAYRPLVWDIYVERISASKEGRPSDERRIGAALPQAALCLETIEELRGGNAWLAGPDISLADLHAAPMIA